MRYRNKTYIKIPFGEIQYGHISKSLTVWVFGKCFKLRKGKS